MKANYTKQLTMPLGCPSAEISLLDGALDYQESFINESLANDWYDVLRDEINWCQLKFRLFGREVSSPRLTAYVGDPNAVYTYSGVRNIPAPWTGLLDTIRRQVEDYVNHSFNSVLANLYRNGDDSMGWHSDDEKELDEASPIASLSLGCERLFRLKHKVNRTHRLEINLQPGSLLIMQASLQHEWQHCIPRQRGVASSRINLTFRRIK
ncbi:MAG: alkylated DNA repair protein [marine bacterium B5-7]|nr:MAG: alkylated DNA repair protein [marine bacterium B5-7]